MAMVGEPMDPWSSQSLITQESNGGAVATTITKGNTQC